MSFWSKLGKGLAIGGAGLGTVLTAGAASPALLGALGMGGLSSGLAGGLGAGLGAAGKIAGSLGNVGAVASGAAKGSADQRIREQQGLLTEQQLAQSQARDQFSSGLDSAKFTREGQDRERKQAILMQLLNNTKDQSITPGNPEIASRMATVTGGARPSNLTTNRESLMALLGQPQTAAPTYQAPPAFHLPQAGALEKIGGGVGLTTSLLGAASPLIRALRPGPPQLGNVNDVLDSLGRA